MKTKIACLLASAFLLAGCWQKSLHSFYQDSDLVADPALVAGWTEQKDNPDDHSDWIFSQQGPKSYDLKIRDKENTYKFDAHLFQFEGQRYLDLFPLERGLSTVPAHHLLKVVELGANLKLAPLDLDWMQKWLRANPTSLDHVAVMDPESRSDRQKDELVLTAPTKALQAFLRQHRAEPEVWGKVMELKKSSK